MRITKDNTIQMELTPEQARQLVSVLDSGLGDRMHFTGLSEFQAYTLTGPAVRNALAGAAQLIEPTDEPGPGSWALNLPALRDTIHRLTVGERNPDADTVPLHERTRPRCPECGSAEVTADSACTWKVEGIQGWFCNNPDCACEFNEADWETAGIK